MPKRLTFAAHPTLETLEAREVPAGQLLSAAGHVARALAASADPVAPPGFTATGISTTQVRLAWADTANETGYRAYQWNGKSWINVGSVGANVTSAVVSGLLPGKMYYFYVESFNGRGSTPSDVQSAVTFSAKPSIPGSFGATAISGTQVRLSWADSQGEDGYRVYQWNGSSWGVVANLGTGATAHTVSDLRPGWTYYFYVEAFNANGAAKTSYQFATTFAAPPVPTNFTAAAVSRTQVQLSWTDTANETGYRVLQWNGTGWVNAGNLGANATSTVISNLSAGRTYYFILEAFNANGATRTRFQSATTPAALAAPPSFAATPAIGGVVRLTWADTSGETGYRVYLWNGFGYNVVGQLGAGATSFDVSGLARMRTYYFYVEAFRGTETAATGVATVWFG